MGKINKYTLTGDFVQSFPIAIDGRGLSYNRSDGYLYASVFTGDVVKVTNLEAGEWQMIFEDKLQSSQASFAMLPEGQKIFDFYAGTLKIWNFPAGDLFATQSGFSYGNGGVLGHFSGNACVAVDEDYIYTWNANIKTIYVYDIHDYSLVTTMTIPYGSLGMSLSVFDGFLFVSDDGNYSVGKWYGYNIRNEITKSKPIVHKLNDSQVIRIAKKGKDSTEE
jgi:hypothetical protein